jgi:hypothetical protein
MQMAIDSGRNGRNGGWRKYFKVANTGGQLSPISGQNQFGLPGYPRQPTGMGYDDGGTGNDFAFRNYASRLPEVYSDIPTVLNATTSTKTWTVIVKSMLAWTSLLNFQLR